MGWLDFIVAAKENRINTLVKQKLQERKQWQEIHQHLEESFSVVDKSVEEDHQTAGTRDAVSAFPESTDRNEADDEPNEVQSDDTVPSTVPLDDTATKGLMPFYTHL